MTLRRSSRVRAALRLALLPVTVLIALFVAWKLGYFELDSRRQLYERAQDLREIPGVEIGFSAAVALVVVLCLPLTVTTIVGGAVFGPWWGASLSFVGALVGTTCAFLLSRRIARAPMRRLFGEHHLLRQLRRRGGVVALFRLRVMPVAPFGVLDYVAGLADVSLPRLLLATALGSSLNVLAYAYVGHTLITGLASAEQATRASLWLAAGVTLTMLALSLLPNLFRDRDE